MYFIILLFDNDLSKSIITNASDLKETDSACWISETDAKPTLLKQTYENDTQTLTIETFDGTPLDLTQMRDIHYGRHQYELNICEGATAHYYHPVNDTAPDLSTNNVTVWLKPHEGPDSGNFFNDLDFTMSILNTTKDLDPHETQQAQ